VICAQCSVPAEAYGELAFPLVAVPVWGSDWSLAGGSPHAQGSPWQQDVTPPLGTAERLLPPVAGQLEARELAACKSSTEWNKHPASLQPANNLLLDRSGCKKQKNILRIGIQSLGSMLWGDDICSSDTPEDIHSLTKFLYVLRGLLRKSLSACIVTVPAHLIQNKAIMERVTNLSDMVVGLESFIGSERETNPLYKDYQGLVHVHQIPRLNSLICDVSDTKDLAFRLKRKLFTIERLHLPPDLSDTVSRASKQDLAGSAKLLSSGCGAMAIGKKHLDF
ncbi:PREDICTED: elongator complex protein 4, partial [Merops nubicus]|uniref:elongator complex protein 4 n=1 Tax=Merops nubicus TaxID=57421 RepID=UPI0004F0667E